MKHWKIVFCLFLFTFSSLLGDTVVLKNGKAYKNVKTKAKSGILYILFEDGHTEKKRTKDAKKVTFLKVNWFKRFFTSLKKSFQTSSEKKIEKPNLPKETKIEEPDYYFPIGVSFVTPLSFNDHSDPKILQLNYAYGKSKTIWGVNAGLVNLTDGNLYGVQAGLVNFQSKGEIKGIQGNVIYSSTEGDTTVLRLGGLWNVIKGNDSAISFSFVGDYVEGDAQGFHLPITPLGTNVIKGNANGAQGVVGYIGQRIDGEAKGLQFCGACLTNYVGGNQYGMQLNGISITNFVGGDVNGVQGNLFFGNSLTRGSVKGVQIGPIWSHAGVSLTGLQVALVNTAGNTNNGWQIGVLNYGSQNTDSGQMGFSFNLQWGGINFAKENAGIQIGVLNFAREKANFQFGVLNIALKNPIPVLPIMNFDF